MDVGYYMANAGGRLLGTILSGLSYQAGGLALMLGVAAAMVALSALAAGRPCPGWRSRPRGVTAARGPRPTLPKYRPRGLSEGETDPTMLPKGGRARQGPGRRRRRPGDWT